MFSPSITFDLQTFSLMRPQPCDRARCFTSGPLHRPRQRRQPCLARAEGEKKEGKGLFGFVTDNASSRGVRRPHDVRFAGTGERAFADCGGRHL